MKTFSVSRNERTRRLGEAQKARFLAQAVLDEPFKDLLHPLAEYSLAEAVALAIANARTSGRKVPSTLREVREHINGMMRGIDHQWLTGYAALDVLDAAIDGRDISKDCRITHQPRSSYPSLSWVRSELRWNFTSSVRHKVLAAYVVGSEAKGTAGPESDLDIAVVIPQARPTALSRTERYHTKFTSDQQKPKWNGRVVDFQFFYPGDVELEGYSRIPLAGNDGQAVGVAADADQDEPSLVSKV